MRLINRRFYDDSGRLLIKPYRMKDLAELYDVSPKTMRKWLKDRALQLQQRSGHYLSAADVSTIVGSLGVPQKIETIKADLHG